MSTILQIVRQEDVEKAYNRKHIDGYIRESINCNPDTMAMLNKGVDLVNQWLAGTYYASKNARLEQIKRLDIKELVYEIFVGIAYVQKPELFTSVTAQLAGRLGFDDKRDAIVTVAELVTVICATDAYDITKADRMASLMIQSRIPLPEDVLEFIKQSQYLPPMVCKPLELHSNYDSGYLSHKDSLILGKGNHHNGNICLDVLNKVNSVALKLDVEFLRTVQEDPTTEFTEEWAHEKAAKKGKTLTSAQAKEKVNEAINNFNHFKGISAKVYMLMHKLGNEFHLTHKVDKRGRIYAQGYHINTQGTPYKKAMIELANEEVVTGV